MDEELKLLADYCFNEDSKVKIKIIWKEEVEKLLKDDDIKMIYELYTTNEPGAWYYIISKENMRYIVKNKLNDVNTQMMMKPFLYDKQYEEVDNKLLSIIYTYDKLPIKKKSNGCIIKILAANEKYALVEEQIGDIKYYPILVYGVPVYDCKTTNLTIATNMFFKDFYYKGVENNEK